MLPGGGCKVLARGPDLLIVQCSNIEGRMGALEAETYELERLEDERELDLQRAHELEPLTEETEIDYVEVALAVELNLAAA